MKCPFCAYEESKVVDSRPAEEGCKVRRRRECLHCHRRFTTYEVIETSPIIVIKKDGSRDTFDSEKLLHGMLRACEKRSVSIEQLEDAVTEIQTEILNSMEREVPSNRIGALAMEKLKSIDEVAYIRFVSVYQEFRDIHSFLEELEHMLKEK